ncbi:MAG: AraC family transcriptional regulator [Sphaerochaeta sp.]|nr:AraC family transcriptional regulator [Sphaerochaeta sp.]
MVQVINEKDILNPITESHYAFQKQIIPSAYPQMHDFYEITFITEGNLRFIVSGKTYELTKGDLFFIRPHQIHTKIAQGVCEHINLAFSATTLEALFEFLYSDKEKQIPFASQQLAAIHLKTNEANYLKSKLDRLSLLNLREPHTIKAYLRTQLVYIFTQHLLPAFSFDAKIESSENVPIWFQKLVKDLDKISLNTICLDTLVDMAGKTREHVCRCFQKYLHTTPIAYINTLKINYAANMLLHSDDEIIDIAYSLGFQSLSNFYALFKKELGQTPLKFRKNACQKF